MAAAPWSSPLQANVFVWIVTKGGDSLFIDPLAEQVSCETMTANPLSGAEPMVPLSAAAAPAQAPTRAGCRHRRFHSQPAQREPPGRDARARPGSPPSIDWRTCAVLGGLRRFVRSRPTRANDRGYTVSTVTLAPIQLAKAIPCRTAFPASSDPSVAIRILVYIGGMSPVAPVRIKERRQRFTGRASS
jgi:hypothetical protein